MHTASAVQNLPTVYPPLRTHSDKANTAATTATADTSSASANDLQTTFLNLLSQELQNQDPTDPVDSTQMVGQMISLNQLDQLISINLTLDQAASASAAKGSGANPQTAAAANPSARAESADSSIAGKVPTATTASSAHQLPFNPATMMPWAFGDSATMAPTPGYPTTGAASNTINLNAGGR